MGNFTEQSARNPLLGLLAKCAGNGEKTPFYSVDDSRPRAEKRLPSALAGDDVFGFFEGHANDLIHVVIPVSGQSSDEGN